MSQKGRRNAEGALALHLASRWEPPVLISVSKSCPGPQRKAATISGIKTPRAPPPETCCSAQEERLPWKRAARLAVPRLGCPGPRPLPLPGGPLLLPQCSHLRISQSRPRAPSASIWEREAAFIDLPSRRVPLRDSCQARV